MEKARQYALDLQKRIDNDTVGRMLEERQKYIDEHLKPDINNLLQMYLPDHITVRQVEVLGCVIDYMIRFPEEFLTPNKFLNTQTQPDFTNNQNREDGI